MPLEYLQKKVPIRENLRKSLIFDLDARLPIGIILGFYGYHHEVMFLLKNMSHATRAYIVNANGLPGFVIRFDIIRYLKEADEAG